MIEAAEFDFATKRERAISPADARGACERGLFCWIDIEGFVFEKDAGDVERLLREIGVNEKVVAEVLGPNQEGRYDVHEDCLHLELTEGRLENARLVAVQIDVVLSHRFVVTFRRNDAEFLRQMKRTYREDFVKFAQSPGFLLYEIGDHLIETYRKTLRGFAGAVEAVQLQLFGEVTDQIFLQVSELTSDILVFRKILMASRELMHELASRRSPFVSETTQPFIHSMAGTLERLGSDLATERDVLSETLGLYMGMVSHRTNKVISRLTVISIIFLPLSFLCGVYGTNFKDIPATGDSVNFIWFCLALFFLAMSLLGIMRRMKWL